jgi:hypothetical protein
MFYPTVFNLLGFSTGKADEECPERTVLDMSELHTFAVSLIEKCNYRSLSLEQAILEYSDGYWDGVNYAMEELEPYIVQGYESVFNLRTMPLKS